MIKSYKGFNKDMTCRGFQYEIGKEYETSDEVKCCENGFHACEYPLDCFGYYPPNESVYCEVEQDGQISKDGSDTKVSSSKIKIGAQLDIAGLVKASFEFVKLKADKSNSNYSEVDKNLNESVGNRSANSATGDGSANSATGYGAANVTTGTESKNDGMGQANISVGWGKDNKCKGCIGSYLVISEWGDWDGEKYPLICAQMVMIDGETIKADTYYMLKEGKIIEAEDENLCEE
nr:MAG TPA: hypothetical protein [Caudoviricetes sp.]